MPNIVPITITVTDADAGAAINRVTTELNALGPAGEAAGAAAGAGLDQVGAHALTARESVRLVSEELGVRVPRAMQSVIAQSELMTAVIGAIAPAMIAIGGVDILMHIGESAYAAYQKYFLMKDAIDASNAAITRLGDASEAALNRAAEAQERYIRMTEGARQADTFALDRFERTPYKIPLYGDQDFSKSPDSMKGDLENITGESVMPKDLDATIAKLEDYEKQQRGILAIYQQFQAMGDPFRVYTREVDAQGQLLKNVEVTRQFLKDSETAYLAETGVREKQIGKDKPETPEQEQAIQKEKEKVDAILSLENSARNAQLSGEALLEAQREEAIDNFVKKYGQSRAAIDAIDSDYASKEIALWQKQWEEADKAMLTAQQASQQQAHTGAGSIENNRQNAFSDIADKKLDAPGAADEMRAAANLKANTEILAAQKEFEDEMQQVGAHADDQQVQGYARIAAEASVSVKKIEDDWQKLADKVGALSAAGVDAQLEAADRIV